MNNSKNEDESKDNINNNIESTMKEHNESNISIHIMNYNLLSSQELEKKESFLIKILKEINSNNILNYLSLKELIIFSVTCKSIKSIIEKYNLSRLKTEYNDIKNYEEKNSSLKNKYIEKYYQNNIISHNNWFHYDINKSIEKISKLNRHTISQIKGIKKLPNLNEKLYAPFCILFSFDAKNERVINNGWKKTADYIMSDSRFFIQISNLKIENFDLKNINNALIHLNIIETYIEKIKRFSTYLYELNLWCKSIVIYYFLVHPYTLNDSKKNELIKDKDTYEYITIMEQKINNFYLFKGFLENKKLLKPKLGEYIFNFDYDIKSVFNNSNNIKNNEKKLFKIIEGEYKIMGNILSYLNINECLKFISFNKSCFYSFEESLNISCYNILKKIFILKYNTFNELYSLIPTIFENNIFSKYFFMLEDIVYTNNSNIFFLIKDHINYIKNYKGDNELINTICKIFCILFNIKVEKIYNEDYSCVNLYIKSVILFCVKENSLTKLIKYLNIFNLNNNKIKSFYEELTKIYTIDNIKKVKNINKGFYQLFIWELYIFEYIKQLNPFLLMDKDTILNRSPNALNEKQINIINNYMFCLEKLKKILKIKYHFKNLFFSKNNSKSFTNIIKELIEEMKTKRIYNDNINYIIENYNKNQSNISKAFFRCQKTIMNKNNNDISLMYQKIMEQIILINLEMVKRTKHNNKIEDTTKNESFYINYFTSRKKLKFFNVLPKNSNKNKKEVKSSERQKIINNNKFFFSKTNKVSNLRYDFNTKKIYPRNKLSFSNKEHQSEKLNSKIDLSSPEKLKLSFRQTNNIHVNIQKINNIQDDIFITKILFFLSINEFPKFSLVNKRFIKLIKTHVYIRLFFLEKKKLSIEKKYSRIVYSIDEKRQKFYSEHKMSPPNLCHSCKLLSSLSKKDIFELRNLFKNYKIQYEIIISVLCIFLDIGPNIYYDETRQKIIDFYTPGKQLLYNKDVINIIKKLDLDNINYKIYTQVEKIMQNDAFYNDNLIKYSPCLINLIKFEFGVIEYFKSIKKYSLNIYDYHILNNEEIEFCKKINESLDMYYKIKNYTFNKCQLYHSQAIKLLKKIDLDQNLGGEINDFIIYSFKKLV